MDRPFHLHTTKELCPYYKWGFNLSALQRETSTIMTSTSKFSVKTLRDSLPKSYSTSNLSLSSQILFPVQKRERRSSRCY